MTYIPKKSLPHEYFDYYSSPRQRQDGKWAIWCHNALSTAYIVATFPTEELARNHAIGLNVIAREEATAFHLNERKKEASDASYQASSSPPHVLGHMSEQHREI